MTASLTPASPLPKGSNPLSARDAGVDLGEQVSYWSDVRRRFLRNRLAIAGMVVMVLMVLLAVVGPFVFTGPYELPVAKEQLQRPGSDSRLYVSDEVKLSAKELSASNGVIHPIDTVIALPDYSTSPTELSAALKKRTVRSASGEQDIAALLAGDKRFSTLTAALKTAGIDPATFKNVTMFAPTNAAFKKLDKDETATLLEDKEKLTRTLFFHVVKGIETNADIARYGKRDVATLLPDASLPFDPREAHLLGSDDQGRDILRRLVRALGISLRLAAAVTVISTLLGMILGGMAGFIGGGTDAIISRMIDALYAIPYVIIGIAFITILGRQFWVVMVTLVFTGWVGTARLFRASVLQTRSQDFIEAARSTGASNRRIILNHIVPNALPPILVSVAFSIAGVIAGEAIYSFLGIGFIEPTPALGVMIRAARSRFQEAPHVLLVPAITLMLLTLSVVLVGDGLRDALDPKLRGAD
jgi:ABC-type dipeptide/oligopeptide/nickel transport system permease subunit